MNVHVVGVGTLAAATRNGCRTAGFNQGNDFDLYWFCEDVPLNGETADYAWVLHGIRTLLDDPAIPVLISSQLPVGTVAMLEREFPEYAFAYYPENLRVATAETDFLHQTRIIVGRRTDRYDDLWRKLCKPFTNRLILTDPETAEMTKHAMNGFLALQIAYANEIAAVAREVGANPHTVAYALRFDSRVSPNAPILPGDPFGGGHLARDCRVLEGLSHGRYPLLDNILASNSTPK